MSTAPNGWQNPKTSWGSTDVPLPPDFNRIEGNLQAIESGSRTLDPTQAPSGNSGSLRQILSWFANRVKAITGASNWYNAPATTLAATKSHMDATSGVHGATSSATAHRLVIRDASGRAKFVQGAGTGDAVVYPVPVTSLKKAQGSYSGSGAGEKFAVHRYAFGSPDLSESGRQWVRRTLYSGIMAVQLQLVAAYDHTNQQTITWDYLTASGHPSVWAEVDEHGEIVSMWEAEDPANPDFPDEPPIEVSKDDEGNPISGHLVLPLLMPDEWAISTVRDRLLTASRGQWLTRSRFADLEDPVSIHRAMCDEQLRERGLEIPDDIRAVFTHISDYDRRHWYLQLWLRQASRLLHDHRASTLIPLYREMCRVDRRTGQLVLC